MKIDVEGKNNKSPGRAFAWLFHHTFCFSGALCSAFADPDFLWCFSKMQVEIRGGFFTHESGVFTLSQVNINLRQAMTRPNARRYRSVGVSNFRLPKYEPRRPPRMVATTANWISSVS